MCKSAEKSVGALMLALEPTVLGIETDTGIASTPAGAASIKAFDALQVQLSNWVPGTSAQVEIEAVNAFAAVFSTLPFPPGVELMEQVIVSGLDAVLALLQANSPAPLPTTPALSTEEVDSMQTIHAHAVAATAEAKITARIGYKPSLITKGKVALGDHGAIAGAYRGEWNKAVAKSDPKYAHLKQ